MSIGTRIKSVRKPSGKEYNYIQLIETRRTPKGPRQRVIATLGRLDREGRENVDRLMKSLSRYARKVRVLDLMRDTEPIWAKSYGDVYVAERIWRELGLEAILKRIGGKKNKEFSLERATFCMVYDRLADPGSKLSLSEKLMEEYLIEGSESLELQHLYRALDVLYENKDRIEESLFHKRRDLFSSQLELVFFDTTSSYFDGSGEASELKRYGHSRDKRPDRRQVVIGLLITREGIPIAIRVFPGNTADARTIRPILDDLRKRFGIKRAMFVCDQGMVSEENLRLMVEAGYDYTVGAKMASHPARKALSRQGRYHKIEREDRSELWVKEAIVEGERYIVCYNPDEAERERAERQEILMKLQQELATNPKSLIVNRGYRKFLRAMRGFVEIDPRKVSEAEKYDGKYVIRTSDPHLTAESAALAYRELWRIERAFRTLKSSLEIRPVYHWTDRRIEAHVFICFLALVIAREIELRLNEDTKQDDERITAERALRTLRRIKASLYRMGVSHLIARTQIGPEASKIFSKLKLKEPPVILKVLD